MKAVKLFLLMLVIGFTACQQTSKYKQLDLEEVTINELMENYENGTYSIADVTEAYLQRIEEIDKNGPALNSMIYINPDAMETARMLDEELQEGTKRGPLHGIPIVLKDNIDTYDMPTTAGARVLEGSIPPDDAFITKKLRDAGAIILGKANLSEWANFHSSFSSSGWSGLGGQTHNPYDVTRNPCGSSSGPGAAPSANLAVFGIGTETNGSITCPSSANGLVGIKPTVGLLSRSGIIPISFTQDTPGPMARNVTDAAIALGTMVGVDEDDSKTAASEGNYHTDYTQFLNEDGLEGKRIGFWKGPLDNHHRVDTLMYETVRLLEDRGATIVELEQISEENVGGDSFQVLLYEFKDGLNNYFESLGDDAPVETMEELVKVTLADSVEMRYFDHDLLITASEKGDLESEEYTEALERMMNYTREEGIDKVMDENNLDAIVSPTGGPAWKTDLTNGDNFSVSSSSPAARAGYPNITVPMGYIDGLPIGVSFFGRAWSEPELIEIAYAFEQITQARKAPGFKNAE
ncbi:amidase [Balneolaceae bacterium YR4-1]|uniref:Amidase n=1 Tax=Halalkalibaculum roseum TaxID=2709311 RepID=A0A6M1SYG3_9BACT|nr:amidase [Halalkalibaculum roseum]NGP77328.1 amidase [Halalkalibaculum roseum]